MCLFIYMYMYIPSKLEIGVTPYDKYMYAHTIDV